jgi:hypothetical protein
VKMRFEGEVDDGGLPLGMEFEHELYSGLRKGVSETRWAGGSGSGSASGSAGGSGSASGSASASPERLRGWQREREPGAFARVVGAGGAGVD